MNEKAYQRLTELQEELGNIANSFAGNVTGPIAFELHAAAGRVFEAQRMMKEGITTADTDRQAEEWCDKQMMPLGLAEREIIKSFLRK